MGFTLAPGGCIGQGQCGWPGDPHLLPFQGFIAQSGDGGSQRQVGRDAAVGTDRSGRRRRTGTS